MFEIIGLRNQFGEDWKDYKKYETEFKENEII